MSRYSNAKPCADLTGEPIQKRLNSAVKRRTTQPKEKDFVLPDESLTEEELCNYYAAFYRKGHNQFWSIIEILRCAPNGELAFKHIQQIYRFLYGAVLDEKTLRNMFVVDSSKVAKQVFKELDIFNVRDVAPMDFMVSLANPEIDYVPKEAREAERKELGEAWKK